MTIAISLIAAGYYLFGLVWLLSGVATGWLTCSGNLLAAALWILTAAAVWPLILLKLVRDVARGIHTTKLH